MSIWSRAAGVATVLMCFAARGAWAQGPWEKPAAALADDIANAVGHAQARLIIRNNSTVSTDEIPQIRRLLEQNLRARGVQASGAESADTIRVTLSENLRGRLWVAEITAGSETHVAMVEIANSQDQVSGGSAAVQLRKERFLGPDVLDSLPCSSAADGKPPLLAVAEGRQGLLVLKQGCLLALDRLPSGSFEGKSFDNLLSAQPRTRDPRGLLVTDAGGDGFLVFLPGMKCAGGWAGSTESDSAPGGGWSLNCHASDDPWPILTGEGHDGPMQIKAFFNVSRDYFTGVVMPNPGVDLPPFYAAALVPRVGGAVMLIGGIDGKVQLAENDTLRVVSGTHDWGSDFASLHSGCGAGTQVIVSGSGDASEDSLRAYELPAAEALPVSAPLPMEGTVTTLWGAPDGKSVLAIVRKAGRPGRADEYEVDRVTASCN